MAHLCLSVCNAKMVTVSKKEKFQHEFHTFFFNFLLPFLAEVCQHCFLSTATSFQNFDVKHLHFHKNYYKTKKNSMYMVRNQRHKNKKSNLQTSLENFIFRITLLNIVLSHVTLAYLLTCTYLLCNVPRLDLYAYQIHTCSW